MITGSKPNKGVLVEGASFFELLVVVVHRPQPAPVAKNCKIILKKFWASVKLCLHDPVLGWHVDDDDIVVYQTFNFAWSLNMALKIINTGYK